MSTPERQREQTQEPAPRTNGRAARAPRFPRREPTLPEAEPLDPNDVEAPDAPPGCWAAALAALGMLLPGVASISAVSLYLLEDTWSGPLNSTGSRAFLTGTVLGLAAWIAGAFLLRDVGSARGANPAVWRELEQTRYDVRARYDRLVAEGGRPAPLLEARRALDAVDRTLGTHRPGVDWIVGAGYLTVWRELHRADEALLEAAPPAELVAQATYDYLRVRGSTLPCATEVMAMVATAANTLSPDSLAPIGAPRAQDGATAHPDDPVAPRWLRQARRTIADFRDDSRAGLIRARNQLVLTIAATALLTYLLLGLALFSGATREMIIAASAFYLVAGVVGLFRQLQVASARDTVTEEDFGLSIVRLVHQPLFSGIAGVAGVVVTRLATSTGDAATLSSVFSLEHNPLGLVVAAAFGLTPNLLTSQLHARAESYKHDLKSSKPANVAVVTPP